MAGLALARLLAQTFPAETAGKPTGTGRSTAPLLILGLLEENPYCTITKVAEELGVAFTTAQRGIDRLVSLGILESVGDARRNRVFRAQQVMDILDEPPTF